MFSLFRKLALGSVKSWEVYDETDSDEAIEKLMEKLAGGIQRDGVMEHSALAVSLLCRELKSVKAPFCPHFSGLTK